MGMAMESNEAISTGRRAGLQGWKLAGYSAAKGAEEGIWSAIFQRIPGLSGTEKYLGRGAKGVAKEVGKSLKDAVRMPVKQVLKDVFLKDLPGELIEEEITEVGHLVIDSMFDVQKWDMKNLWPTIRQTALGTFLHTALVGGAGKMDERARANRAAEVRQLINTDEGALALAHTRPDILDDLAKRDPKAGPFSRKEYQKWGLPQAPQAERAALQKRLSDIDGLNARVQEEHAKKADEAQAKVNKRKGGTTPPVTPPGTPPVTPPGTPPVTPPVTPPSTPPGTPPATPPASPPVTPQTAPQTAPQMRQGVLVDPEATESVEDRYKARVQEEADLTARAKEEVQAWKKRARKTGGKLADASIGALQTEVNSAFKTLGMRPSDDLSPEGITRAYRNKAASAHPDRGGSTAAMTEINRAYELLSNAPASIELAKRKWIKDHPPVEPEAPVAAPETPATPTSTPVTPPVTESGPTPPTPTVPLTTQPTVTPTATPDTAAPKTAYDSWDESILQTGELPDAERKVSSIAAQAWQRIREQGYTAEEARDPFIAAARTGAWLTVDSARSAMRRWPKKKPVKKAEKKSEQKVEPAKEEDNPAWSQLPEWMVDAKNTPDDLKGMLKSLGIKVTGKPSRADMLNKALELFQKPAEQTKPKRPEKSKLAPSPPEEGPQFTRKLIARVFPGRRVEPARNGGWHVYVSDTFITIRPREWEPIDWEKAEESYGPLSAEQRAEMAVYGSFEITTPDGVTVDGAAIIKLAEGIADEGTLRHEALHLARALGLIRESEWDALVREYAPGATNPQTGETWTDAQIEEVIAQSFDESPAAATFWQRIASALKRFVNRITGGRVGKLSARDAQLAMQEEGFWARKGEPKTDQQTFYSVKSFQEGSWTNLFSNTASKKGWSKQTIDSALGMVQGVVDMFLANSKVLPLEGATHPNTGKPIRALVSNADFKYTLDPTRLCKRVMQYWATVKAIEKKIGRTMTEDELLALGQEMRRDGDIPGCIFCYVEASRRAARRNASAFTETKEQIIATDERKGGKPRQALRDAIPKRDNLLKELGWSLNDLAAFVVDERAVIDTVNQGREAIDAARAAKLQSIKEQVYRQMKIVGERRTQDPKERESQKARKAEADKKVKEEYRKVVGEVDAQALRKAGPKVQLMRLFNEYVLSAKGTAMTPLGTYLGEILTMEDILESNERAGLRWLSATDLDPTQLVDTLQAMADATVVGVMGHEYTKEPYAVLIFGNTGMKQNLSIALNGRAEFTPDSVNGMPMDVALELQRRYANTGTMFVAKNLPQLEHALDNPDIRMIIPHHAANWSGGPAKYGIFDLDDFSDVQHEHWVDKAKAPTDDKGVRLSPKEAFGNKLLFAYWMKQVGGDEKQAIDAYLRFCRENNLVPKFDSGRYMSGETKKTEDFPGYTTHPGYAKLLKDYARTDSPQEPLNVFEVDQDRLREYIQKFVEAGGWRSREKPNPKTVTRMTRLLRSGKGVDLARNEAQLSGTEGPFRLLDTLEDLGLAPSQATPSSSSASQKKATRRPKTAATGERAAGKKYSLRVPHGEVKYSLVKNPELLRKLESEPTIKVFRSMQMIDGKLYPPMSAKVGAQWRDPTPIGQWEQADEDSSRVDDKGNFKLDKGNKTSITARYNPYFHTSRSPLNDQFSSSHKRSNLVTVEVEIPESELTSGYKADKAKDSVGEKGWKSGPVSGKLKNRTVILSRYSKVVRILPDSEVADKITQMLEGKDIEIPYNVVTPTLRKELVARGVRVAGTGIKYSARKYRRGRPDLANHGLTKPARDTMDDVDLERSLAGRPPVQSDEDVNREAERRLEADYEGELKNLKAKCRRGAPLDQYETVMGKTILTREHDAAMASGDPVRIADVIALMDGWRESGATEGRAFRQRRDPVESPAERGGRLVRQAVLVTGKKEQKRKDKLLDEAEAALADGDLATAKAAMDKIREINEQWAKQVLVIREKLNHYGIDLDDLWQGHYTHRKAIRALRGIRHAKSTFLDRAYEYWANAILSAPTTHVANLAGTAHAMYTMTAGRLIDATINFGLKDPQGAEFGEFKYLLGGILPGLSRGARNFLRSWSEEMPMLEIELGRSAVQKVEDRTSIPGTVGRVIRQPWALLGASDDFMKSLFIEMEVGARAYRIAKSEGLEGDALQRRIADLHSDIKSLAWNDAYDVSKAMTFQQEGTEGAQRVKRAANSLRGWIPGARYIIPFVNTLVNIFETSIQISPAGWPGTFHRMYQNHVNDKPIFDGLSARVAAQVPFIAFLFALLSNDPDEPWITGSEANMTAAQREVSRRTGRPATSVKIRGKWYDYNRLEPEGTVIAFCVDLMNSLRSGDMKRMVGTPIGSLVGQANSKTFMKGIGQIIDAIDSETPAAAITKYASNFAASWVPNVYRSARREWSDVYQNRRDWGTGAEWAKMVGTRTLQKSELWFGEDYPIYDVWGQPAKRSESPVGSDWLYRFVVPVKNQKDEVFVADRLLLNWNLRNPDSKTAYPREPRPEYVFAGKKQSMTPKQFATFQEISGTAAKLALSTKGLVELDPANPTPGAVEWIKDVVEQTRSLTRQALIEQWHGAGGAPDPAAIAQTAQELVVRSWGNSRPPNRNPGEGDTSYSERIRLWESQQKSRGQLLE
jgi:curved DNA-binding protein CbpA